MIEVFNCADWLAAKRALLLFIPLCDDIPDQAVVGSDLDLAETFLSAILALRPTRAFFKAQRRFREKSAYGGFGGGDLYGLRFVRLGRGDQALSLVREVRTDSGDRAKQEQSQCQRN